MNDAMDIRFKCTKCKGTGETDSLDENQQPIMITCPDCEGDGFCAWGDISDALQEDIATIKNDVSDLKSSVADVMDKCNDILEAVTP